MIRAFLVKICPNSFNGKFQPSKITEKEPYYLLPDVTEVVVVVAVVVVGVAVVVVGVAVVVVGVAVVVLVASVPVVPSESLGAVDISETQYLHIISAEKKRGC